MTSAPRTIAITSGKGGVGKTLTTVNLAIAARRSNLSVLILDGDLGLAHQGNREGMGKGMLTGCGKVGGLKYRVDEGRVQDMRLFH